MFGILYTQSAYQLLSNTIPMDQLIQHAKRKGHEFVAITDENLHGMISFYEHAQKEGLKPILGMKLTVQLEFHATGFLVYVSHQEGYPNLLKLALISQQRALNLNDLSEAQKGLIFVTSGEDSIIDLALRDDKLDEAKHHALQFQEHLEVFYLGLSLQTFDAEFKVAPKLNRLSEHTGIRMLPVYQTSYLDEEDRETYEALIRIQDEKAEMASDMSKAFLSKDQLLDMFYDYPFVFDTLREVVNTVSFLWKAPVFDMPDFITEKGSNETYLKSLAVVGLKKRLKTKQSVDPVVYQKRLLFELDVIIRMGYTRYFLIVYDFVRYAKTNRILVGPGRGSAAGSLVAYCLGITDVDPIAYDLLFERFLNPERISMPDIDMDFPDDKRDEVLKYVQTTYGAFHCISIVTFGSFQLKSSIRDIARVMKIDPNRVTGIIQSVINQKIDPTDHELTRLLRVAKTIEGLPRHTGTHAAGIILAKQDLQQHIPLQMGPNGFYQSQWEQSDLEKLGLLKIDFLGIRNLSIIADCIESIRMSHHDLLQLPLDDAPTYRLLATGETAGIFQLESMGMKAVLKKLKPNCFEDIVALNALYRPGPMEFIDEYIERRNGKPYRFIHPDLRPILEKTYGIIVYQEQIMRIAHEFAGYSLAQADLLRRAISKKDKETLDLERQRFVSMCQAQGHDSSMANDIYDLIVRFADYGFNRSHSVAYSLVAYQMAYLKANHFESFMTVLLSSVIGVEGLTRDYIEEMRKKNVVIQAPDINVSTDRYVMVNQKIYMPLQSIKSMGKIAALKIIEERNANGNYLDFQSFKGRLKKEINAKNVEMLIHAGALDGFGLNHRTMMNHKAMNEAGYEHYVVDFVMPVLDEYSILELAQFEKEALGFYVNHHPLTRYQHLLKTGQYLPLSEIENQPSIQTIAFIKSQKTIQTKTGKPMMFLELDDGITALEVTCFTQEYEKYQTMMDDQMYVFSIKKDTYRNKTSYVLKHMAPIKE